MTAKASKTSRGVEAAKLRPGFAVSGDAERILLHCSAQTTEVLVVLGRESIGVAGGEAQLIPSPVGAGQLQEIANHVKSRVVADAGVVGPVSRVTASRPESRNRLAGRPPKTLLPTRALVLRSLDSAALGRRRHGCELRLEVVFGIDAVPPTSPKSELEAPGRTRAMRAGAYSNAGAVRARRAVGVSNATGLREACATVNRFLRTRFPDGAWTSIAVLYNPCMGHRDIQNMPGHSNHALAGGDT
ncbi:hypothetical protein AK812_SmicGene46271, partial [Symbiodinium microadriaticum]